MRRSLLAAAILLLAASQASFADSLKLILPFPQGTTTSQAADIFRGPFEKILGQKIESLNINTSQGIGGIRYVAKENRGDANTLVIGTTTPLVHVFVTSKPDYDVERDLTPISLFGIYCEVLVTRKIDGVSDFAGFARWAKARPDAVKFAAGTLTARVLGTLLQQETELKFGDIIGAENESIVARLLVGGDADATIMSLGPVMKPIKDGKLVPLAAFGSKRCPALPEVPTFTESGVPGLPNAEIWAAIYAPAGISKERQLQFSTAVSKALTDPDVKAGIETLGFHVKESSSDWLKTYRLEQVGFWKDVMRKTHFRTNN